MTTPAKTATKGSTSRAAKNAAASKGDKAAKTATATKEAKPRKQAEPKPPKFCLHGCGTQTKGGDFVIGHDAKLKSILQKAHVAGETTVDLGGTKATPLHGQSPMAIAKARGWERFLTAAKTAADEKANRPKRTPKQKGGPVEVGRKVSFSYRGSKRTGEVIEISGERAKVSFDMDGKAESRPFGLESLTVVG